jgi:hypothetical protein
MCTYYGNVPVPGGIKLTGLHGVAVFALGTGYLSLIFAEDNPFGITVRGIV